MSRKLKHILISSTESRGVIVEMEPSDTGKYYGEVQKKFAGLEWPDLYMIRLHDDFLTPQGLYFNYDLVRDGGYYGLIALPGTSKEDIEEAKRYLKVSFDVLSIKVFQPEQMTPFVMPERAA
jgi:hypothetical protein